MPLSLSLLQRKEEQQRALERSVREDEEEIKRLALEFQEKQERWGGSSSLVGVWGHACPSLSLSPPSQARH